ncbi:MAG: hypothetical protein M1360_00940 [Candidatus Marsarchaeota archaeon]|nr:hypothetical protein [Candidatus Marsarchaeota archaeon]MCL5418492.1 hypothetical protein [Candidatus Marsarchaeota archaeon]
MASARHSMVLKIAVVIIVVLIIAVVAIFAYLSSLLSHVSSHVVPSKLLEPSVSGFIAGQGLLQYNNSRELFPYALVNYNAVNATSISFNATILMDPMPLKVYMLNTSNECYQCASMPQLTALLSSDLKSYNFYNLSNISNVSIANVDNIENYSILIVPTGLMPSSLIEPINASTSETPLSILMSKQVIVIYIGDNFSRMLLPGSIIVPDNIMPGYLESQPSLYKGKSPFYFNSTTFSFTGGFTYGPLTYEYIGPGVMIAFSNTLQSWKSPQEAASDIAKAIDSAFWIPRLASGGLSLNTTSLNSSGSIGIVLDNSTLTPTISNLQILKNSFGIMTITSNFSSSAGRKTRYLYIYFSPGHAINGTISMQSEVIPTHTVPVTMTIFTNSTLPISIQPHITIYNMNMSSVYSIPLPFSQAYGNFTFIKYIPFNLPPGRYIGELQGYSGNLYAASLFDVAQVNISLVSANFSANKYRLFLYSKGLPISGVNYTITLNGAYKSSGILQNGTVNYSLPAGTPQIYGTMKFVLSTLSSSFSYTTVHAAPKIVVNKQYIELVIVVVVVLLMVTMVKAPNRDEFYIDVPSLPQQKKIDIKVSAREVLSQFDKLNVRYHWKFMPLTKSELRSAISSNMRYNNMPIGVTYSNIDSIVDQLVVKGYLVGADNLYAPAEWIQKSGHDIEYLATFKKIRLYLVTHAYMFTDIDASNLADIVATIHGDRAYIVIYSKTSKFLRMPVYGNQTTYIAFLNSMRLEEFRESILTSFTPEAEQLKIYMSSGSVKLVDADAPGDSFA